MDPDIQRSQSSSLSRQGERSIQDFASVSLNPSQERSRLVELSTSEEVISADVLISLMNQDGHELTYVRELGRGNYSSVHLVSYENNLVVCKLIGGEFTSLLGAAGSRYNLETDLITLNQNLSMTPELRMVIVNKNQQLLAVFASYIEGQDIREACIQSIHGFSKEEIQAAFYSALDEAKRGPLPLYLVDTNHSNFLVRPTSQGKAQVVVVDPAGVVSLERMNRSLEQYEKAFPEHILFDQVVNPQEDLRINRLDLSSYRSHSRHSLDNQSE